MRRSAAVRPMDKEGEVLAALDRGEIRRATSQFLDEVRRAEDPGDRAAQAETVTSILAEMFWFAIRNRQYGTAKFLVNRLVCEAERRGVLWAYPEALYLKGNLLHELALRDGSTSNDGTSNGLQVARTVLERAIRFAMRVPRVDIVS